MADQVSPAFADPASVVGLVHLQRIARGRGFQPILFLLVIAVGALPAGFAIAVTGARYSEPPIIGLALAGPFVLLLIWTALDREGMAAREVFVWLRGVEHSYSTAGARSPAVVAAASVRWPNRSFRELLAALRAALTFRRAGRIWLVIARFIYPLFWATYALLVIVVWVLNSP